MSALGSSSSLHVVSVPNCDTLHIYAALVSPEENGTVEVLEVFHKWFKSSIKGLVFKVKCEMSVCGICSVQVQTFNYNRNVDQSALQEYKITYNINIKYCSLGSNIITSVFIKQFGGYPGTEVRVLVEQNTFPSVEGSSECHRRTN